MRLWLGVALACCASACGCHGGTQQGCPTQPCPSTDECDTSTHQCVPLPTCNSTKPCPSGLQCINGTCSGCTANIACTLDFVRCDPATNGCAACASAADCPAAFHFCAGGGCSQCAADHDCGGATPFCQTPYCVQCRTNADCPSGGCTGGVCTPTCMFNSQCPSNAPTCSTTCQECQSSSDCADGGACTAGACHPSLPGQSCAAAVPIDLAAGSAIVSGDLSGGYGFDQGTGNLVGYYRITVPSDSLLAATLSYDTSFLQMMGVELFAGTCGALDRLAADPNQLSNIYLGAGDYFIAVTNPWPQAPGAFTLSFNLTPSSRPLGASCFDRIPLAVPGTTVVQGDLSDAGVSAPDFSGRHNIVYGIDLPQPAFIEATVTPSSGLSPALELRSDCLNEDECQIGDWGCYEDDYPGGAFTVTPQLKPAGHYAAVVLQNPNGGTGTFQLSVTVTYPEANNDCSTAQTLLFDGGVATASGDSRYAPYSSWCVCGSCGGSTLGFQQLVYQFSTAGLGARSFHASLMDAGASLTLLSSCGPDAGPGLECVDYPAPIDEPNLPEGDYFLAVADWQPFTFVATLGQPYPPPPNETCATALVLDLDAGSATATGDTRGSGYYAGVCALAPFTVSRDVVYELVLPQQGFLQVSVTPDPGFQSVLEVDAPGGGNPAMCGQGFASEGACAASSDAGVPVTWSGMCELPLAYALVDGAPYRAGTFTLNATFTPSPANDVCSSPVALSSGVAFQGDLTYAFPQVSWCSTIYNSPAEFFTWTATSNGTATATLTPRGFAGAVAAEPTCPPATCLGYADGGVGAVTTASFTATKNTTYVIQVNALGSGGPFSLVVQ